MKVNLKKLEKETREKCLEILYAALDHAKSRNEIKSFINDLLTESERIMVGRRILIAKKLLERQPYSQIAREVGVGFDTIFRVKKWLGGRHQGYEKILEKFDKIRRFKTSSKSGSRDYYPTSGFAEIRRRYRNYYWLSELLDEINKDRK